MCVTSTKLQQHCYKKEIVAQKHLQKIMLHVFRIHCNLQKGSNKASVDLNKLFVIALLFVYFYWFYFG